MMNQFDIWRGRIDSSGFRDWFQAVIVGYKERIKSLESDMQEFLDMHGNDGDGCLVNKNHWIKKFKQLLEKNNGKE